MFFLLQLIASRPLVSLSEERRFVSWMRETNNFYTGDEYHLRLGIFLTNARVVDQHNKGKRSFTISLNKFAAMTPTEFSSILGFSTVGGVRRPNIQNEKRVTYKGDAPDSFDWREKNVVNTIKDQDTCGGAWAFSVVAAQESVHAINTNELLRLSEQNLIDCCTAGTGCGMAWPDKVMTWIVESQDGHYNLESEYPYKGVQQSTCEYSQHRAVSQIVSVESVLQSDENLLKEHIANVGPVTACLDCRSLLFMLYHGGIYDDDFCIKYTYSHSMCILGYGSDNGVDYWLIRNSWGLSWGESGYIRYLRGVDLCNVADAVFYPVYQ